MDTTPPTIVVNGSNPLTVNAGDTCGNRGTRLYTGKPI
jgi:hypothetical protein